MPSGSEGASSLEGILGRNSCRAFQDRPVPEDVLNLLLACAQSAPAKSDLQQYSIIVVDDPEKRAAMASWSSFTDWMESAPLFLIFCGDLRRQRRIAELHGLAHSNDNVDTFMNTAVDAALALGFFIVAAEAAGVGCCPISVVRNHIEEVIDLLSLPPGVFPVAGLAAGYPAKEGRTSMRLPPSLVVHRNQYDDSAFKAEIAGYDERRHAAQPIPPEKQRHRRIYGTADKMTWSGNTARQMSQPERARFSEILKRHGFALS